MQPVLVETHAKNIRRFERLLDEEREPAGRRVLERLIDEEREELRTIPFRWGAPPTD